MGPVSRKGLALVIVGSVMAVSLVTGVGAAASTRITQGDATAVLNAFGSGGWAVIKHNSVQFAGPGDAPAAIRPFKAFDGRHYCSLDWHTIVIADVEGGDSSFTQQQAVAIISQITAAFYLDGQPLQITQTAVQRFNNPGLFGLEVAYYSQWGQTVSPSALAVGAHGLRGVLNFAGSVAFDNTIKFYVDPAGSSTCS
jgi:hypothetical protein